jgi:hypothetical protein
MEVVMFSSPRRRALWLVPLALFLPGSVHAQYNPQMGGPYPVQYVQVPVQTYVQQPYVQQPVPIEGGNCPMGGCAAGNCGGCMPVIGPNTMTGWGALWNWLDFKVAKMNCCGPTSNCGTWVHCQPKPPCILFPRVCGKCVCNPCEMEHFGYYNTCWAPWGFHPDFSHCPTPQLASVVPPKWPKTEYFSNDPRAQQPGLGGSDEMPMREKERDKEREEVSSPSPGYEPLPQPRRLSPRMQVP